MPFKNYCVLAALASLSSDGDLERKCGRRWIQTAFAINCGKRQAGTETQKHFYTIGLAPFSLHFSE